MYRVLHQPKTWGRIATSSSQEGGGRRQRRRMMRVEPYRCGGSFSNFGTPCGTRWKACSSSVKIAIDGPP